VTSFVVALLMIVMPMPIEAQTTDLQECTLYVRELSDEELIEYMKNYEYISMVNDIEEEAQIFDSVYDEDFK
jgi:hypothetical protein